MTPVKNAFNTVLCVWSTVDNNIRGILTLYCKLLSCLSAKRFSFTSPSFILCYTLLYSFLLHPSSIFLSLLSIKSKDLLSFSICRTLKVIHSWGDTSSELPASRSPLPVSRLPASQSTASAVHVGPLRWGVSASSHFPLILLPFSPFPPPAPPILFSIFTKVQVSL